MTITYSRVDTFLTKTGRFVALLLPFTLFLGPAYLDGTISIICLLFLVHSIKNKDFSWLKQPWVMMAIAVWGVMLLSSAVSIDPSLSFRRSGPWFRFILLAVALSEWIVPSKRFHQLFKQSFIIAIGFVTIDLLYQYFMTVDILGFPLHAIDERLTGPMSRPRVGIILAWCAFPVIVTMLEYALDSSKTSGKRFMAAILPLLVITVILLSGDRMGFLLSLFGCGLLMLFYRKLRLILLAIFFILSLITTGIFMHDDRIVNRQYTLMKDVLLNIPDSPYGRLFESGFRMFAANPILGVGARHFRTHCNESQYDRVDEAKAKYPRCNNHPHNIYVELLSENGLITFTLFLGLVAIWAMLCIKTKSIWRHNPFLIGTVIAIILRLWPLASTGSLYSSWSIAPLWIMVGILLGWNNMQKNVGTHG